MHLDKNILFKDTISAKTETMFLPSLLVFLSHCESPHVKCVVDCSYSEKDASERFCELLRN